MSELLVVHVEVRVRPEGLDAFRRATLENAAASRREPGVVRFDVAQDQDDPARFVLVEVYRDAAAAQAHKASAHYATWRDAVAPLMAAPRAARKLSSVSPAPEEW